MDLRQHLLINGFDPEKIFSIKNLTSPKKFLIIIIGLKKNSNPLIQKVSVNKVSNTKPSVLMITNSA